MDTNFDMSGDEMKRHPTIPDTSASPGVEGAMAYDESYLYICIADNTWRRVSLESF